MAGEEKYPAADGKQEADSPLHPETCSGILLDKAFPDVIFPNHEDFTLLPKSEGFGTIRLRFLVGDSKRVTDRAWVGMRLIGGSRS